MSPVILEVSCPAPVAMPRGAVWAAQAVLAVWHKADAAWQAITEPRAVEGKPRSADAQQRLAGQVERERPSLSGEVRAIARHLRTFETRPVRQQTAAGDAR
jgi:hypothetical protein